MTPFKLGPAEFRLDVIVFVLVLLCTTLYEGERIRNQIADNGSRSRIVLEGLLSSANRSEEINKDFLLRLHNIEVTQVELKGMAQANTDEIKAIASAQKKSAVRPN